MAAAEFVCDIGTLLICNLIRNCTFLQVKRNKSLSAKNSSKHPVPASDKECKDVLVDSFDVSMISNMTFSELTPKRQPIYSDTTYL